jgi:hypothetical protein
MTREDGHLAVVERIEQAMSIEPFRPGLADVIALIGAWRQLNNENGRLRAELRTCQETLTACLETPY